MRKIEHLLLLFALATVAKAQTPTPTITPCEACLPIPTLSCAVVSPTPTPGMTTPYTFDRGHAPTPWPNPSPSPSFVRVDDMYQPHQDDGTLINKSLGWRIFKPDTTGPWPVIVVVHGGGFHDSTVSPFSTGDGILDAAADLQCAGYYVLVVGYRMAREGAIPDQSPHPKRPVDDTGPDSGIFPYQEYDVESMIKAARADPNCLNDLVGVLGGSGGATHAIYAALDTAVQTTKWPFWNYNRMTHQVVNDRPNAAVGLSGAYNFADRTDPMYYTGKGCMNPKEDFERQIENYTRTKEPAQQYLDSPVALLDGYNVAEDGIVPLLLINSRQDAMPYHQIELMDCALHHAGWIKPDDYQVLTVASNENDEFACEHHAFGNWPNVKDDVLTFFDCKLKGICSGSTTCP